VSGRVGGGGKGKRGGGIVLEFLSDSMFTGIVRNWILGGGESGRLEFE